MRCIYGLLIYNVYIYISDYYCDSSFPQQILLTFDIGLPERSRPYKKSYGLSCKFNFCGNSVKMKCQTRKHKKRWFLVGDFNISDICHKIQNINCVPVFPVVTHLLKQFWIKTGFQQIQIIYRESQDFFQLSPIVSLVYLG